eukprot:1663394-Alexandrium_andersonii.AAC.1
MRRSSGGRRAAARLAPSAKGLMCSWAMPCKPPSPATQANTSPWTNGRNRCLWKRLRKPMKTDTSLIRR